VLNGVTISVLPNSSNVTQMEVSKTGRLFARASNDSNWYAYLNFDWYPVGASIPVGPIPVEVTLSTNLNSSILSTSPNGTVIAGITVTMSDGSGFTGTLSWGTSDATFAGISGSNVVVISAPPAHVGVSGTVTATENGAAVSAGAALVVIEVGS
jgi:hypothetical protein